MKTLKKELTFEGVGLHSGEPACVTLCPYDKEGIYFENENGICSITEATLAEDSRLTAFRLPNGVAVRTGEHMLGTIVGMGLDSVLVKNKFEEIPILDGSGALFAGEIALNIADDGKPVKKPFISSPLPVEEQNGKRFVIALPSETLKITYTIDYTGTPIGVQTVTYDITRETFQDVICRARTFGLTREFEFLKKYGLARGGSLENAMVFDENGLLEGQELRFPLECVTHKVLDLLGDLALLGAVPVGHYIAHLAGHSTHGLLCGKLKKILNIR